MALIKKEFLKKEEMEGFFVHTFPLSVGAESDFSVPFSLARIWPL